jgi:oligopeptide/dipeptide ABC transporter ATP-binding protein
MAQHPIMEVQNLVTLLGGRRGILRHRRPPVRAVNDITFAVLRGEVIGIVGESGCGKSTLGRTILGIQRETSGSIVLENQVVSGLDPLKARRARRSIQYIYQDAAASLDPWWSVGKTLRETLAFQDTTKAEGGDVINKVLAAVGLSETIQKRFPHELSGGQLRRIAISRVLILEPQIVIFDEPTAGLDLSVQASVLHLIKDMQKRLQLTYLFISHDLSVVRQTCNRVAIMYLGRIVEVAPTHEIFTRPVHPYTKALLAAVPHLTRSVESSEVNTVIGEPPSPAAQPSGCAFRTRCAYALAECAVTIPPLDIVAGEHRAACIRWKELKASSKQGVDR